MVVMQGELHAWCESLLCDGNLLFGLFHVPWSMWRLCGAMLTAGRTQDFWKVRHRLRLEDWLTEARDP